jgi:hypothetical protein
MGVLMDRETIIRLAREAGFKKTTITNAWFDFAKLVAEHEREACAKLCEALVPDMSRTANDASVWDVATFDCAAAIRARGNT